MLSPVKNLNIEIENRGKNCTIEDSQNLCNINNLKISSFNNKEFTQPKVKLSNERIYALKMSGSNVKSNKFVTRFIERFGNPRIDENNTNTDNNKTINYKNKKEIYNNYNDNSSSNASNYSKEDIQ